MACSALTPAPTAARPTCPHVTLGLHPYYLSILPISTPAPTPVQATVICEQLRADSSERTELPPFCSRGAGVRLWCGKGAGNRNNRVYLEKVSTGFREWAHLGF